MAAEQTSSKSQPAHIWAGKNLPAVSYMLAAVMFFSFIPLAIIRSGGVQNPFMFNAAWQLGLAVGCALFVYILYIPLRREPSVLSTVIQRAPSWTIFYASLAGLCYGLFALSTRFIDASVAAILLETWPMAFILLTAWLLRKEQRYKQNILSIAPFFVTAFLGFVFVVISQTEGFSNESSNVFSYAIVIGVSLALLAAIAASFDAFPFAWGNDLARNLPSTVTEKKSDSYLVFFGTILGFAISNTLASILSMGVGFTFGESIVPRTIAVGFACGILLHAPASILLRRANLTTDNLGVNALGYAIPIFSLIWLWIYSEINVNRFDYLVIGAAAIITANLLINFEAEVRLGFKALILSLGGVVKIIT